MVVASPAPPSGFAGSLKDYARQAYLLAARATGGRPSLEPITEDVADWVDRNRYQIDAHDIAHRAVRAVDRVLHADVENLLQPSFFDDSDNPKFLALGASERVQVDVATETDFDAWWLVQVEEHNHQVEAFAAKGRVYYTVKRAWKPGQSLREVRAGLVGP